MYILCCFFDTPGTFTEQIETTFAYITHRIYVHQKYTRLLISDLFMQAKSEIVGGGVISLDYPTTEDTTDINFQEAVQYNGNWYVYMYVQKAR